MKRGKIILTSIILSLIFISIIGFASAFSPADITPEIVGEGVSKTIDLLTSIIQPISNALLNTDGLSSQESFLKILAFLLVLIIIFAPVSTINLFEASGNGTLLNWIISIIVAIIGVRFLPEDILLALTAPSSAFVAVILMGIPFAAMFFVTMKIKSNGLRKFLWLFFMIMLTYLIFLNPTTDTNTDFQWIYTAFLIGALIMLILDGSIFKTYHKSKAAMNMDKFAHSIGAKKRKDLRKEMKEFEDIANDSGASAQDKAFAAAELTQLTKIYKKTFK